MRRRFRILLRHSRESGNPGGLRDRLRRRLHARFRRGDEDGFSLVELMVVIVIIGLLATIVIINVMPALDRATRTKAQADIRTYDQAVQTYRLNNLRYPTTEEGLQILVTAGELRGLEEDPWGNPYRYVSPGRDGQPYTILSLGADGREGGDGENADITN